MFRCKTCSLDIIMDLHLEHAMIENLDIEKLLRPLKAHQKFCKVYHMPCIQNACFNGPRLSLIPTRDREYEHRFVITAGLAPLAQQRQHIQDVTAAAVSPSEASESYVDWWNAYLQEAAAEHPRQLEHQHTDQPFPYIPAITPGIKTEHP